VSRRGLCLAHVGAHWTNDPELRQYGSSGWVIEVCGYARGHIGKHQDVDGPDPRWRRLLSWLRWHPMAPAVRLKHRLDCARGRHRRLHLTDGTDWCIDCEDMP
jgi:hypothetical protein